MFARTARSHASTNIAGGTGGIIIRSQPRTMRFALAAMFHSRTFPSAQWWAFAPSYTAWP